jgi:uncharacterized membrane protein
MPHLHKSLTLAGSLPPHLTNNRNMAIGEKPTKEDFTNWQNDPNNWKWGIFYFNKKDKRIFPPKRDKYAGWTVNFANPISILAIIALIILSIVFSNHLKKA